MTRKRRESGMGGKTGKANTKKPSIPQICVPILVSGLPSCLTNAVAKEYKVASKRFQACWQCCPFHLLWGSKIVDAECLNNKYLSPNYLQELEGLI
ncbi:unnamed protein product [Dovyalis caffra]|uniref:Uncharacterized protein n=1 Tax=Dovyalis caffra TaxID=77055 RepID=A0AAV1RLY3_9ROSI|nr:unnamed protein product [Dovyalis caffra]